MGQECILHCTCIYMTVCMHTCTMYVQYIYMYIVHVYMYTVLLKIFNPPPQFSRLGTLCPTLLLLFVHSFNGMGFSLVSFSSFLSTCIRYCMPYTYILYMYMYMYFYVYTCTNFHCIDMGKSWRVDN